MKIQEIYIQNYKSIEKTTIYLKNILALIGRNNSGKSNVLNALRLFFESTTTLVNKECFSNNKTDNPIEILITFNQLSPYEKTQFKPWLCGDVLVVGKKILCKDDSFTIENFAIIEKPEQEWLCESIISGNKIDEWWPNKDKLTIGKLSFGSMLGTKKPKVGEWKEHAKQFIEQHAKSINWVKERVDNPQGYSGVLKGTLPNFIFIPAVKDIKDEAKILKNNPFGNLLNSVLEKTTEEKIKIISKKLGEINEQINRTDKDTRISSITEFENNINELMKEIMECDVEISIPIPEVKEIFGDAKIFVDDGVRTSIESKGHGMQRSMILTILRAYSEMIKKIKLHDGDQTRSTIFAIEEPELYLHPQAQRTLSRVLRSISGGIDQVIYSTQSSIFVDIGFFDEICVMRRVQRGKERISIPSQLTINDMLNDLSARGIKGSELGIRELYFNVFNPIINEGFFADKVVIVEGPSELYSIPIYSKCLGYDLDQHNIAVVHSDGKGPINRILRIFNGFKIPTYVLFDGDKNNEKNQPKKETLELLQLLGEPIGSIDELSTKIEDTYAVMENKYETTLKEEIEKWDEYIKEAGDQMGSIGKPLQHRYAANKITRSIDPSQAEKKLPSTIVKIVKKIKVCSYRDSLLKKT